MNSLIVSDLKLIMSVSSFFWNDSTSSSVIEAIPWDDKGYLFI
jgi:hypothetical protein